MNIQVALNLFDKLTQALKSPRLAHALMRNLVLAGAEHRHVLSPNMNTVVDIGANRGQFALAAREWAPKARVISFEPLPGPASVFRSVFSGDDSVLLHQVAIGSRSEQRSMHVSEKDDSSSLLPISSLQTAMFPGTGEIAIAEVRVGPLEEYLKADDLQMPAMLKLDVQGFEFEALSGCESMLSNFNWIYCECSFVELYSGQRLASDVINWLAQRGCDLKGIYNPAYDRRGKAVQGDFLFLRKGASRLLECG